VSEPLSEDSHLVDIKMKFGKILTFVNVSFADPKNFFASLNMDNEGNLIIPRIKTASLVLDSALDTALDQLAASNNRLTLNTDPDYTSPGPSLASNNTSFIDLSGEIVSLEDRIKNLESRVEELTQNTSVDGNVGIGTTNIVIPANAGIQLNESSSELDPRLRGDDITRRSTSSAILSEASSSADPTANDIQIQEFTDTSTQRPIDSPAHRSADTLNLTSPEILLATSSVLTPLPVTESLSSDKLFADEDAKISGNLNVFGKTTLASTAIAGDLTVDGTLSINGNSVNVIGSPECSKDKGTCGILYLQNSPLAYEVNFFNGLVIIDKTGNLRAQTVTVAEFRTVGGKISGSGEITSGSKSVDIENPLVKSSSRILITPNSETDLVLAVTEKIEGKKFTVSVAEPPDKDIVFDWFLINESP